MEKSKLFSHLEQLERYLCGKNSFKTKDEEINFQRTLIIKIQTHLESTDKSCRDIIIKNAVFVSSLVNFLQVVNESTTLFTAVKVVSDIIGKTNYQKRAQSFVYYGLTKTVFSLIYNEFKENYPNEDLLLLLHSLIYRLSSKDRKIGVRARLTQCLPVVVSLLRSQCQLVPQKHMAMSNSAATFTGGSMNSGFSIIPSAVGKNLTNLLQVLRIYSGNLTNAGRLGKIGIVSILTKLIIYTSRGNSNLLKMTLECFQCCVRTKNNSGRAINTGCMPMLLHLFSDWNRLDSKDRQLGLRKSILSIIKNLINTRAGKKAFFEADGLHILYGFCDSHQKLVNAGSNSSMVSTFSNSIAVNTALGASAPIVSSSTSGSSSTNINNTPLSSTSTSISNSDMLVTLASLILRKCFPRNRLPLTVYTSVLQCPLPPSTLAPGPRKITKALISNIGEYPPPAAPRSTSPINKDYTFNQASCQGDVEYNPQNSTSHTSSSKLQTESTGRLDEDDMVVYDDNINRSRAQSLFKAVDKKLQKNNRKSDSIKRHQTYLNRISLDGSSLINDEIKQSSNEQDSENSGNLQYGYIEACCKSEIDQEFNCTRNSQIDPELDLDKDQQDEQIEQNLVEQILMNGNFYRPIDDRPLAQLVDSYQHYIYERDIADNHSSVNSASSANNRKADINENETACLTELDRNSSKNIKKKEVLSTNVVSVQMNTTDIRRDSLNHSSPKKELAKQGLIKEKSSFISMSSSTSSLQSNLTGLSINAINHPNTKSHEEKHSKCSIITSVYDDVGKLNKSKNDSDKPQDTNEVSQTDTNKAANEPIEFSDEHSERFTQTYIKNSILITRSLGKFEMIAYPDLFQQSFHYSRPEPLLEVFGTGLATGTASNKSSKKQDNSLTTQDNSNNNAVNKKQMKSAGKKSSITTNTNCKVNGKTVPGNSSGANRPPSSPGQQWSTTSGSAVDYMAQNKILDDLRRVIDSEDILEKVVFDLDEIVAKYTSSASNNNTSTGGLTESISLNRSLGLMNETPELSYNYHYSVHSNHDELDLNQSSPLKCSHLTFDSQFECGNLRKAIQIRQYEYDLILNPDINTNHHIQWFYFRIANMESKVAYRFNIINCEKPNSQFNFGMQPLLFSVKEAVSNRIAWRRWGSEIFYYKNHFARSAATCGGNTGRSYFTCTFMIEFPHSSDVCYLAYHYPYSYTRLLTDIDIWTEHILKYDQKDPDQNKNNNDDTKQDMQNVYNPTNITSNIEYFSSVANPILFSIQQLCTTILGNPVPLLTITNRFADSIKYKNNAKKYIFLTSRVHPGESNSSWIIKGTIDFLLSEDPIAVQLRDLYIFKIVPMLNPDGVINGNHRCSMAGQDLNRRWLDPCENLNPTIFHCKGLLMLLTKLGHSPLVYCDFHGHSRRKNVFMFGCSPLQSWISDDYNNPSYIDQKSEDQNYLILPSILQSITPAFSFNSCSFSVEKIKESTARVVVWRQFGVQRSYTMESSYCSCENTLCPGPRPPNTSISQGTAGPVVSGAQAQINVPLLQQVGARFAQALFYLIAAGDLSSTSAMAINNFKLGATGSSGLPGASVGFPLSDLSSIIKNYCRNEDKDQPVRSGKSNNLVYTPKYKNKNDYLEEEIVEDDFQEIDGELVGFYALNFIDGENDEDNDVNVDDDEEIDEELDENEDENDEDDDDYLTQNNQDDDCDEVEDDELVAKRNNPTNKLPNNNRKIKPKFSELDSD